MIEKQIAEDCTEGMLVYGANINISRMAPNEIDGLKPVQLRILYACFKDKKLSPKSDFIKVSAITGAVSDKYHPHADAYDPLVSMAQSWSNPYPLIYPQGNFGTPTGYIAGASRYIEAKLTPFAWDCYFEDYNPSVIDFIEAANKKDVIPEYLPSRYPVVLINGSMGIGYAKASSIPPHNLQEVILVTSKLMDDPETEIVLYPDSPTGCDVVGKEKFEDISDTGRGTFKFRSTMSVEELKIKNRTETCILVHNLPYSVNYKNSIEPELYKLMTTGKITFIKDVLDESYGDEVRIVIVLKKDINPYLAMEKLYKMTEFETSYSVNINTIRNFKEYNHTYKSLLLSWIKYRRDMKLRLINNKIMELSTRILIIDGILKILTNKDYSSILSKIHKECEDKQTTIDFLMKYFDISDIQADKIASMQLYTLNHKNAGMYMEEKKEKEEAVKKLLEIRKDPKEIDLIIKGELLRGIEKYGVPRKSKLYTTEEADNLVPDISVNVLVYNNGTIKKTEGTTFGRFSKSSDIVGEIRNINSKNNIHIFTSNGYMNQLNLENIPSVSRDNVGTDCRNLLKLRSEDSCVFACNIQSLIEEGYKYILFTTKQGLIKKSELELYANSKTSNLLAILLNKDDIVVNIEVVKEEDSKYLLYTKNAESLILNVQNITPVSRMAKGVIGIKLDSKDTIQGLLQITNKEYLVIVTDKGYLKKSSLETLPENGRNGEPSSLATITRENGIFQVLLCDDTDVLKITTNEKVYEKPVSELEELTRKNKCEKVLNINKENILKVEVDVV